MFYVKIPATSANMGPAFDTAGMAFELFNTIEVYTENDTGYTPEKLIQSKKIIDERIEAQIPIPTDKTNLIYTTIYKFSEIVKKSVPKFSLRQIDAIPLDRGLGSSAACIVAGLMIGNELVNANYSRDDLLSIAVEMEGHPDNVAPAFLGGMVVGASDGKRFEHVRIDVSEKLEFLALIPDFPLATSNARAVLPSAYTKEQAVFNCSRVALLVSSMMSGNFDALQVAMQDKIHQPYRKILIPGMEYIFEKALELGAYGVYLSGAGPTIMVVCPKNSGIKEKIEEPLKSLKKYWLPIMLNVCKNGAELVK